jgi:hypothetical protein
VAAVAAWEGITKRLAVVASQHVFVTMPQHVADIALYINVIVDRMSNLYYALLIFQAAARQVVFYIPAVDVVDLFVIKQPFLDIMGVAQLQAEAVVLDI